MPFRFHQVYRAAVMIKGVDGGVETAAGLALSLIGPQRINDLLLHLAHHSLSRSTAHFSDFYLISHGFVKLGLAAGLLAERAWSYTAGFWVLLGLVAYQLERFAKTKSVTLLIFTLYDVAVVVLLIREMRIQRHAATGSAPTAPSHPSKT